jgi:hypothetical protein
MGQKGGMVGPGYTIREATCELIAGSRCHLCGSNYYLLGMINLGPQSI